jgi:hypothetical protein
MRFLPATAQTMGELQHIKQQILERIWMSSFSDQRTRARQVQSPGVQRPNSAALCMPVERFGRRGSRAGVCPPFTSRLRAGVLALARSFFFPLKRRHRLFVPSVANLKTARALAFDDDLAVRRAQFDLADVAASSIDLLRDQGRALQQLRALHGETYPHRWMRTVVGAGSKSG